MKIDLIQSDAGVALKTVGLMPSFGYELCVTINSLALKEAALSFLELIIKYVESGFKISPDDTLGYGCWITKVQLNDRREFIFFEQEPKTGAYVPGINSTLELWNEQHAMCDKYGADYAVPSFDQMIVLSEGVLEGDPAEGVRYPSPEHMSGWWITTDKYDGDISNLITVHIQTLAINRPDLVKYLGLPFRYRFHDPTNDAWLDEKIDQ